MIDAQSTADALIAFETALQPLYRANRDNPALSARVFRIDAQEAENRRKSRIRREEK